MELFESVPRLSRRAALAGAALLLPGVAQAARPAPFGGALSTQALHDLETASGARIGVAAIDTGTGNAVFFREGERFVMCSTFKLSLAALELQRADKGAENLDQVLHYDAPVLDVSPATTRNLARGMTVAELSEAAVIYSDNTAANLLLDRVGGPAAMTGFWRALGDHTTRLDDNEPKLNIPSGERNTTTPAAMMANLKDLLLGDTLTAASRQRLLGWMHANTTGATKLRAGLPATWLIGDKTGAGPDATGLTHDIAVITPLSANGGGRKPILAAVYVEKGQDATVAAVGRILATTFA